MKVNGSAPDKRTSCLESFSNRESDIFVTECHLTHMSSLQVIGWFTSLAEPQLAVQVV